eukprot:6189694-Pleurochrysis_carterae.AAC.1
MQQLFGVVALREARSLNVPSRRASQLAKFGKLMVQQRLRSAVPKVFEGIVPQSHPFSCKTVLHSLLLK